MNPDKKKKRRAISKLRGWFFRKEEDKQFNLTYYRSHPWRKAVLRTDIRKNAFKSLSSFLEAIRMKGYKALGSGAYSYVFHKEGSDKVLKICYDADRDGWIDYVTWANKKGYGGSLAPKVYGYKELKFKDGSKAALASMEKLEKTSSEDNKADAYVMAALFSAAIKSGNALAQKLCEDQNPGLFKFGMEIKKEFVQNLDLHGGNLMTRKDGSLCVTDPIAAHNYERKVKATRMRSADFQMAA